MSSPDWSNNFSYCETYKRTTLIDSIIRTQNTVFPFGIFLYPIVLVTVVTAICQFLLKPLGQVAFVSQMLAGIALGPSFLGQHIKLNTKIFSPTVMAVHNVFDAFGVLYMIFLLSVRIDISIVKKSGKLPILIGVVSFLVPLMVTTFISLIIKDSMQLDEELNRSLPYVASLESTVNFHTVLLLLTDLKLLNSELGRIALSSSLITSAVGWVFFIIVTIARNTSSSKLEHASLLMNLSALFMVLIVVFALRPTMFWMMRQTPEGRGLKHSHVLAVNLMFLGCCFFGEVGGFHGLYGVIILGLGTPINPPMGSRFVDRIEYFVWAVFMPCNIINAGRRVNLFSIRLNDLWAVESVILVARLMKLLTIIIPSIYYRMPFSDALSLGLVLTCRGINDIQLLNGATSSKMITEECFSIMVITTVFHAAIAIPFVRAFYDSSRRYVAYRKHTVQHCGRDAELRILSCIHESDNIPPIINILQALHSHRSCLGIYAMNLEEYIGSTMPQVIPHLLNRTADSCDRTSKVDSMMNTFEHFEQQNGGLISVQCFTAIAPYVSMHDDICSMAFDKIVSLVIIPFQKTNTPSTKIVVKNVIKMAPCSVGILFGRGTFLDFRPIFPRKMETKVCVIFVGGADDREALACGARMVENDNIMLTVVQFIGTPPYQTAIDLMEESHDTSTVNDFRMKTIDSKNVEYKKWNVKEGADTVRVLNAIGDEFALILVGRRHARNSPVLIGLSEWSVIEDLGVIGDILVSADFQSNASILVIQQQQT